MMPKLLRNILAPATYDFAREQRGAEVGREGRYIAWHDDESQESGAGLVAFHLATRDSRIWFIGNADPWAQQAISIAGHSGTQALK
jgi:hypothetical protein